MWSLSRFALAFALVFSCAVLVGCPKLDVIGVSNDSYDFALNDTPWTFQVWNTDASLMAKLEFTVKASQMWIHCTPTSGESTGSDAKKVISVTVDRTGLSKGQHKGTITISASRAVSKSIDIQVTSEGGSDSSGGWALKNVTANYASPYLIEFDFSLRDEQNHAVLAEPAQFNGVG